MATRWRELLPRSSSAVSPVVGNAWTSIVIITTIGARSLDSPSTETVPVLGGRRDKGVTYHSVLRLQASWARRIR